MALNCDPLLNAEDCGGPLLQTHPVAFQPLLALKPKEAHPCFLQAGQFTRLLFRTTAAQQTTTKTFLSTRQVTASGMDAARQQYPGTEWQTGAQNDAGSSQQQLESCPFLVLFGASWANRDIHTYDPTGCQCSWVASTYTSIIPTIFMSDALTTTTLPIYSGLRQVLSYAGMHTICLQG